MRRVTFVILLERFIQIFFWSVEYSSTDAWKPDEKYGHVNTYLPMLNE